MTRLAILVYHALLSLYPHHFRTEFETEMLAVFQDKLAERAAIGWWPELVVLHKIPKRGPSPWLLWMAMAIWMSF